ncbi:MAG: 50S ribosomal protein L19 [Pseudomonadota bacterium]|nr:50S ribosomal protein L19 [Pseudomonadota bacterium]
MNILEKFEKEHLKELQSDKSFPKFNAGDTLKVHLRVKEGEKERVQVFEGVCIAKKNAGINSSFTVRKISYGEGIERVLPLFSPQISKIQIVKTGDVRRSKLYYLRERSGKSARIAEKNTLNQTPEKNFPGNETEIKGKPSIQTEKVLKNNSNKTKPEQQVEDSQNKKNDEKKP